MRPIRVLTSFLMMLSSSLCFAGGSFGGGNGLVLELESNVISESVFDQMITSNKEGEAIVINGMTAQVEAVDVKVKAIEVTFTDLKVLSVLFVSEDVASN